jgi:hypothetical protein
MNYRGLKPVVSQVNDLNFLRFAPGVHSSPSLKARGFLAGFMKDVIKERRARSVLLNRESLV